jgi:hypothetical protein
MIKENVDPAMEGTAWFDTGAAAQRHALHKNGTSGDHVGSYEPDGVGPHSHYVANGMGVGSNNAGNLEFTSNSGQPWASNPTHNTNSDLDVNASRLKPETAPKNAAVMFAIYVGSPK